MIFCTDVDLLHWEPDLLSKATIASQLLASGTGDLSATYFTAGTAGVFSGAAGIRTGQVIVLGTPLDVCLPIAEIVTTSVIRVSSLYDELFPTNGAAASPVTPLAGTGIPFTIRTFWAQRKVVSTILAQAAGADPALAASGGAKATPTVLNPESLRRPCALGTLQLIYGALAAAAADPAPYTARASLYARLYRRAMQQTLVDVDLDGDGRADARRSLGMVNFVRA